MFELIPYKKEHLYPLLDQPINLEIKSAFLDGMAEGLEQGKSVTAKWNGEVMLCGGIIQYWPGRGQVWIVFNESSKTSFLPVFRNIKKYLDDSPFDRVEVCVPCDAAISEKSVRRAKMLGFKVECERAKKYLPGGIDCFLLARVK